MIELTILFFLHRDITKLKSVPEMAFYGLQLLCSPKHGDQKEVRSMARDYVRIRNAGDFCRKSLVEHEAWVISIV